MSSLLTLLLFVYNIYAQYYDESSFWNFQRERNNNDEINLNNTYFLTLKNYQVNAKSASELDYPWIAEVLHSKRHSKPHICTAICIDRQIFITAARCVYVLKVTYTSLMYQGQRLHPKAFVMPTNKTKQMYDDIGFIVVTDDFEGNWKKVQLLEEKRTDKTFNWLGSMSFEDFEHRVIGYAQFKTDRTVHLWKRPFYLSQLDVQVNMRLCSEIFVYNQRLDGFAVPCYHSCTLAQFEGKEVHSNCLNYHGAEGSGVINLKTKRLLGIATWGAYFTKFELPVGMAIPNSDNFFEDYTCAIKIRDDSQFSAPEGYYQALCDNK